MFVNMPTAQNGIKHKAAIHVRNQCLLLVIAAWLSFILLFLHINKHGPILFIIFHKHEQIILFFCRVWIRLINLHLLLLVK